MGNDDFGLKIGIEGEREFKNAIREINQSFKVLGSEMNLVASQFDKQDKSVEAVAARNRVLSKEIDSQKEKIATLEKALANAASSFGETDRRTQSWQIQLNNAKAELIKMEREMEANNKALDAAEKEFDEAEKQADEFGGEIKKDADRADDAGGRFEKLGGVLKGIGVAMGAALAMQIFGKSAQELNPLIAQGSAGIEELTEEAKRMGAVMSEDSLNALGKFDDSIQRLKAGSAAAKNMLGTVLLPQLQVLADDGVALLGEFTRGLSEANGDWTKISGVIGNTVGSLVNMLMENLPKLIQVGLDIVTSIGGAIVENLPVIIDAAVQIVMTLLQALIDALPQITYGALRLVMAPVQGIIDNLPALVEAAEQMIATLASGIGEALPELIPAVVEANLLIAEVLLGNMDKILDAAFQIIQGLAQGLLNALPRLIEALPGIIKSISAGTLSGVFGKALRALEAGCGTRSAAFSQELSTA